MTEFIGKTVFSGIAIGKIAILKKDDQSVKRTHVDDTAGELARGMEAKEKALGQLKALYEKAVKEVGESGAMIFDVHQMMLDDQDYLDSITNMIETQNINAEYAVAVTGDNFAKMFGDGRRLHESKGCGRKGYFGAPDPRIAGRRRGRAGNG